MVSRLDLVTKKGGKMKFVLFLFTVFMNVTLFNPVISANMHDSVFDSEFDLTNLDSEIKKKRVADTFIFVSCSGKSGSKTLLKSFQTANFYTRHCHTITDQILNQIKDVQRQNKKVILIDSLRENLPRKISSFFHHLNRYLELSPEKILELYEKKPVELLEIIQKIFDRHVLKIAGGYGFKNWYKLNYHCLTEGKFDMNKKYQLKRKGNTYFINIRFRDIADWEKIIKSINLPINLKNFKIVPANKSETKWYGKIYKDFLTVFKISRSNFDILLEQFSEESSHFYTNEEMQEYINKWSVYIY